jgi:hypothetical protein
MISIHFYPESDSEIFVVEALLYQEIWNAEGPSIVHAFERESGLHFEDQHLNALIALNYNSPSPLIVRIADSNESRRGMLTHELGHRLIEQRRGISNKNIIPARNENDHRLLYLFLYDTWISLYDESFAERAVARESTYGAKFRDAWEWALSFKIKEERRAALKKLMTNGRGLNVQ